MKFLDRRPAVSEAKACLKAIVRLLRQQMTINNQATRLLTAKSSIPLPWGGVVRGIVILLPSC
jgi:hypothetical protein